jgi:hypothetical protein
MRELVFMKIFSKIGFFIIIHQTILLSSIVPYYSIPTILRPNDTRGISLGLTGSSYNEDLSSYYSNPACLAFNNNLNILFSYIPGIDIGSQNQNILHQEAIGIGFPVFDRLFIGINYYNLDFDNTYYFNDNDFNHHVDGGLRQFCLSGSKLFQIKNSFYSIGINIKYEDDYTPGIGWNSSSGQSYVVKYNLWNAFLCDLGLRYKYIINDNKEINVGVSAINIFDNIKDHDDPRIPFKYIRTGISIYFSNNDHKNIGVLGVLEYQKSLNNKHKLDYWNHISIGFEMNFQSNSFIRVGYLFELNRIGPEYDINGFTYGFGFNTPKISQKLPVYVNLSYSRGLRDYRKLDQNIISIQTILTK